MISLVLYSGCTTYEAVFDYKGELSTHLQLKQGDLVRVHRKEAAGWWRGTVGDQTGWFPSNYVQAAPPGKNPDISLLFNGPLVL